MSVFGTTSAAMNLLSDWKAAQVERANSAPAATSSIRRWQAPEHDWVKINIDAATVADIRKIGIGGVIRDATGGFVKAMCT